MAETSQIITSLISVYKDDAPAGIAVAQAKIDELLLVVDENRIILSDIEGNQFRWEDKALNKADWLVVWTGVKNGLARIVAGETTRTGFFQPQFKRLQP